MVDNKIDLLNESDLDIIGEVMNMSMGSAATAVSTLLDRMVDISTPSIQQNTFGEVDCEGIEPSLAVKIDYVEGISGTNLTLLKRQDAQMIVNLLMGEEPGEFDENFEFDDMSMSAVGEVMNQMMGSSATTMSELLGMPLNISTPQSFLLNSKNDLDETITGMKSDEAVVAISFTLSIKDVLTTSFMCFLNVDLARMIIEKVKISMGAEEEPIPVAAPTAPIAAPPAPVAAPPAPVAAPPAPVAAPPAPIPQAPPVQYQQPTQYSPAASAQPVAQTQIQNPSFPAFAQQTAVVPANSNMNLLMGVKLDVSVVIGRAKQKIKDVIDFGAGTVIELDRQTGSPAEVIVNGQLLAYGDVIVVGDNFGVRITEIVGTKDLLESLENNF